VLADLKQASITIQQFNLSGIPRQKQLGMIFRGRKYLIPNSGYLITIEKQIGKLVFDLIGENFIMADDAVNTSESNHTGADENVQASVEAQHQAQSFIDLPSRWDRWEPLAEVIATIILAIATLATAWSGYQAARWGGEQSTKFSQAGALRTESTRASTKAGQVAQVDIGLFTNWVNAFAVDNLELADFYEDRFRPEFALAFEAWLASDPRNNPEAPKTPFSMPEYSVSFAEEADRLEQEASKTFAEGSEANQISDDYILNTVILASVLFLAGMQSRMKSVPMRMLIVILGLFILAFGLVNIASYPIQ
jgi:hypothetical protein